LRRMPTARLLAEGIVGPCWQAAVEHAQLQLPIG
jgi:hypothetical protein